MRSCQVVIFEGLMIGLILITPSLSLGVSINWGAGNYPLYGEGGVGSQTLSRGCIVHLIWDEDRDGIDEPQLDGLPGDGDLLIGTSWIGYGSFFEGEFSQNTEVSQVTVGDIVYVRAWNDTSLHEVTHFGDTRDHLVSTWTIDSDLAFTLDCTGVNPWATLYPGGLGTGVLEEDGFGGKTSGSNLGRNFPNPFFERTTIPIKIIESGPVQLTITDATGRILCLLLEQRLARGVYEITWDGSEKGGRKVGSGVYFSNLCLPSGRSLREKMIYIH